MDVNINQDIQALQTKITKPFVVSKIKYDPAENALKGIADGVTFIKGDFYIYDSSVYERVLSALATSSPQPGAESANKIASEYETSVTRYREIWESLPRVGNYFELDSLNNVEEVEAAFYRASEKYGW